MQSFRSCKALGQVRKTSTNLPPNASYFTFPRTSESLSQVSDSIKTKEQINKITDALFLVPFDKKYN